MTAVPTIPPGLTATELRIRKAAEDYAAEFRIPIDEIREWYVGASEKQSLVIYMEESVERERQWRRDVAAGMRARSAA